MDKKICVVSMSVGKPASMTAAWINNELIMAERTSYPERRRDMELQLLRELREKEEKGFIVLVEEENSFITGRVGQRVRLRDPFMNGRPVLIEAMQIYKELERQKAIKLPRKESGKYILHQSIFDSEHDKKGDEFFNINWSEITTEHVLTLLGVSLDIENYCTLRLFFDLSTLAGLSRRNLPEAGIRLLFQI